MVIYSNPFNLVFKSIFFSKLDAIASELAYNCRDEEGHSALHICVIKGREDAVEKLATAFPRLITTSSIRLINLKVFLI